MIPAGLAQDFGWISSDRGALLDFDKGANPRFIADLTALKIDEAVNADVAPQPDIRRDQLITSGRFAH